MNEIRLPINDQQVATAVSRALPQNPFTHTEHRPWTLPHGPWALAQTWHHVLFAHWPLDPAVFRYRIPVELEIDTYNDKAWVGIVPFNMTRVHPWGLPSIPWLSSSLEMNVRTYVVHDGKPGVWFLSLDAANPLAVRIARTWYNLPYFQARMGIMEERGWIRYSSIRRHSGATNARFMGRYRGIGQPFHAAPRSLENWLTERYCLYTAGKSGQIYRADIHHWQWPLMSAEAEFQVETLSRSHGFSLPDIEPSLLYARRLDMRAWVPQRVV